MGVLLGGALVFALIVVGCGSGGDDGEGTTSEISKAAFVKRAEAICAETQERASSAFRAYMVQHSGEALTAEKERAAQAEVGKTIVVPAKRQEAEELRALGAPAGDEKLAEAIVGAYEEGVEIALAHPEQATQDGTEAFGKAERLAAAYGLEGC